MKRLQMWMVVAVLVAACGRGEPSKGVDCGAGEELKLSATSLCVYSGELLVETGFDCPAEVSHAASYGDLVVCSADPELPDDFFEEVAERYPDEVPDGACKRVVCSLGEVCEAGTCDAPRPDPDPDPDPEPTGPVASFEPRSVDFGTLLPGEVGAADVTITNDGDAPLVLSNVRLELERSVFAHSDPTSTTLAPGADATITVRAAHDGSTIEHMNELRVDTNDADLPTLAIPLRAVFMAPVLGCADDLFEPNDTGETATAIELGVSYDASRCPRNDDWFTFDVAGASRVEVLLQSAQSLGDTTLQLWAVDGQAMTPLGVMPLVQANEARLVFDALGAGNFAVLVTGTTTLDYTLSVSVPMCTPDDYEPNDSQATATRSIEDAIPGESAFFGLSVCGGESDWFEVQDPNFTFEGTIEVGRRIEAAIVVYGPEFLTVTLHGPTGPVANATTAAGNGWTWHQVTHEVLVEGAYHVEVSHATGSDVPVYRFASIVRGEATCVADVSEPNDDRGSATSITPVRGELLQLQNGLCSGDEDWYAVDLSAGDSILSDIYHSYTTMFEFELYRENEASPRAQRFQVAPGSIDQFTYDVPAGEGGRYYVRIATDARSEEGRHYLLNFILM